MITWLIWTIWTLLSAVLRKAIKFNHSLTRLQLAVQSNKSIWELHLILHNSLQGWGQFNSGIGIAGQFQFRNWNWNWNWWNCKWNWNWNPWNWNWNWIQGCRAALKSIKRSYLRFGKIKALKRSYFWCFLANGIKKALIGSCQIVNYRKHVIQARRLKPRITNLLNEHSLNAAVSSEPPPVAPTLRPRWSPTPD